jgi:hypothetical protein
MLANQIMPTAIVNRSRFFSAKEDPPSDELNPPPNKSESPPPRPRCSKTKSTSNKLEITKMTPNVQEIIVILDFLTFLNLALLRIRLGADFFRSRDLVSHTN